MDVNHQLITKTSYWESFRNSTNHWLLLWNYQSCLYRQFDHLVLWIYCSILHSVGRNCWKSWHYKTLHEYLLANGYHFYCIGAHSSQRSRTFWSYQRFSKQDGLCAIDFVLSLLCFKNDLPRINDCSFLHSATRRIWRRIAITICRSIKLLKFRKTIKCTWRTNLFKRVPLYFYLRYHGYQLLKVHGIHKNQFKSRLNYQTLLQCAFLCILLFHLLLLLGVHLYLLISDPR